MQANYSLNANDVDLARQKLGVHWEVRTPSGKPAVESLNLSGASNDEKPAEPSGDDYLTLMTGYELVKKLESLRRDPCTMNMIPLDPAAAEALGKMVGMPWEECDYSTFGNMVDRAKAALDEALPNGQFARASLAIYILVNAAQALGAWMGFKGFEINLSNLDRVLSDRFIEDSDRIRLTKAVFAPKGVLIPAVETTVDALDLMSEGGTVSVVSSSKIGESRIRVRNTKYQIGVLRDGAAFGCADMTVRPVTIQDQYVGEAPGPQSTAVEPQSVSPFGAMAQEDKDRTTQLDLEDEFVEPGTGLRMRKDKWYVLSDSGSSYSSTGFDTDKAAVNWVLEEQTEHPVPQQELEVPTYDFATHGFSDMNACNVVKGAFLYDFWRHTDPEMLLSSLDLGKASRVVDQVKQEKLNLFRMGLETLVKGVGVDSLTFQELDMTLRSVVQEEIQSTVVPSEV